MDKDRKSYFQTFQTTRMSDQTLSASIIEAVFVFKDEVLYNLITTASSGRRVFKQLCLKGDIPFFVFDKLEARGETDLAFHLACCHSAWPCVLQLYENTKVLPRSREQAFRRALRQGAWEVVTQMVTSNAGSPAQRRTAFHEAVRQEQLQAAHQLYSRGVGLDNNDLAFALEACVRLRLWDTAVDFLKKMPHVFVDSHLDLFSKVVIESIADKRLPCFLNLATERCPMARNRRFLTMLFTEALNAKQPNFILKFCKRCHTKFQAIRVATGVAVKNCRWWLLSKLAKLDEFDLSEGQLYRTMTKALKRKNTRRVCAPALENVLTNSPNFDALYFFQRLPGYPHRAPGRTSSLAEWCVRKSYHHLAVVLALRSLNWNLITGILQQHGNAVSNTFLFYGFLMAYKHDAWDTAVAFLRHQRQDDMFHRCVFPFLTNRNRALVQKCKENGLKEQAVRIAIASNDWDVVREEMNRCYDRSILDHTIREAATHHEWDLVQSLMHRCSQTREALELPLTIAVTLGELEPAKGLIGKIDPRADDNSSESLMQVAVRSYSQREEMVKLCIEAGLSTHEAERDRNITESWNIRTSVMKRALQSGQMPLVKLLHISGAVSNSDLVRLNNDQVLKTQLNRQGRRDIIQYIEDAARNPRSLKELCRLLISHMIGCQPGRKERVKSLPPPRLAKDFIRFRDILNP